MRVFLCNAGAHQVEDHVLLFAKQNIIIWHINPVLLLKALGVAFKHHLTWGADFSFFTKMQQSFVHLLST